MRNEQGSPARSQPIHRWPSAQRPRERLWQMGSQSLSDGELLAIILRSGRRGESALDLGRRLLQLGGEDGLLGLVRCSAEELSGVSGVGPAKAASLLAAFELGRRAAGGPGGPRTPVRSAADAARCVRSAMEVLEQEQFRVLLLDTKHRLLGVEVVGQGGLDHVAAHPREVFKPAIRRSAAAVILAHNHPSGDSEPSGQDALLTERLVEAGRVLGVPVLDHLVIGRGGYVSLRKRGLVRFDD